MPDVRHDCSTATGIYSIVSSSSSCFEQHVVVSTSQCPITARFDADVLTSRTQLFGCKLSPSTDAF